MNGVDILILFLLGAVLVLALRSWLRKGGRCSCGGGNCSCCAGGRSCRGGAASPSEKERSS